MKKIEESKNRNNQESLHWTVQTLNKGLFYAGKYASAGQKWLRRFDLKETQKTAAVVLDQAGEKAEKIIAGFKSTVLDVGESFKSGYQAAPSDMSEKDPTSKKRSPLKKVSRNPSTKIKPSALSGSVHKSESTKAITSKKRRNISKKEQKSKNDRENVQGQELSADSIASDTSDVEPAAENLDMEKEIQQITEEMDDVIKDNDKTE